MHLCTPIPSEMLAFELNADGMLEGLPALLPGGHGVAKRFFFLKYGHFERERERERERDREICELSASVSLSTNNEAEFSYLKKLRFYPLVAEKYNVAIQYQLIKVTWQH